MASEPGGIASKLGTIYERLYAIEQIVRLISGRIVGLRWEPASGEAGGGDIELRYPKDTTRHVQLKRQNRADAKWTIAALQREGVLASAARVVDSSPAARFAFMSSDPVPHLKDICDQLARHAGSSAADFIATRVNTQNERRACFEELLQRWEFTVGDAADEAQAINRLCSMRFIVLDRGEEGEERVNMLVQACLTGDPKVVSASLAAFLEENLGRDVSSQAVLDYLSESGILPRDLARDPSLPTAMLALRSTFIESLRPAQPRRPRIDQPAFRVVPLSHDQPPCGAPSRAVLYAWVCERLCFLGESGGLFRDPLGLTRSSSKGCGPS